MNNLRYWTALFLLATTAVWVNRRGSSEVQVPREALSSFPESFAGWNGKDLPIDAETLETLGQGDYLSRIYSRDGGTSPVGLFIGYFPSQRTGTTIHSPKHCLPGAGWSFESSSYLDLRDVTSKPHRVGEYIITEGAQKQFVIYWYDAHGRSVANEYMAKFFLVADAMRLNRTDGALVRIITPISTNSAAGYAAAKNRAEMFAAQLFPTLPQFVPD